ncbi:KISS1 receptor [Sarotherodon galilaeus]
MSRTRPWDPKSTKVGTGGSLSPAVSSSSSSSSSCSPSPSPSTSRLAYAGSAPVAPLLRPATFHYGGLGQHENSEEEEEEEEQEAEEDNDSTARTLADEETKTMGSRTRIGPSRKSLTTTKWHSDSARTAARKASRTAERERKKQALNRGGGRGSFGKRTTTPAVLQVAFMILVAIAATALSVKLVTQM